MSTRKNPQTPMTLVISAIGAGGDGVGEHEGKPVYVPKTAPGDVVRAHIQNERADGIDARLVEIVTPSPERAAPVSPHYDQCGGCALQHVNENFYRAWKIEKVKATLEKAGVMPERWNDPVFLTAATRRRTVLAAVKKRSEIKLGYHAPRSPAVTDVRHCAILTPALDGFAQKLRPFLPALLPEGKEVSILIQNADGLFDVVFTGPLQGKKGFTLEQHETFAAMAHALSIARISVREREFAAAEIILTLSPVMKTFGPLRVSLPPGAFLQASAEGELALCKFVTKNVQGSHIADLFAGCGTFAGALLETGATVSAFENDEQSVQALQAAAQDHKNLRTFRRDLFKDPLKPGELSAFEGVVFDPPRAGAREQCLQLAASNVPYLIAISCNPGTFARDARILAEGGYALRSVTLIDQFVWSAHMELAALFTRN